MADGGQRGRKALPHEPPLWVDGWDELWFITICCQKRGINTLCKEETANALFESIQFRNDNGIWFVRFALLMPDHLHALASFPVDGKMQQAFSDWKRYTARELDIEWQRDFFDHRLRSQDSEQKKAAYIANNPVRAGLVEQSEDWPFVFRDER